jgi:nucleotide-binding universal stress UspA family protein
LALSLTDCSTWQFDGHRHDAERSLRRIAVPIASDSCNQDVLAAATATAMNVDGNLLVIHVRPRVLIPPTSREDPGLSFDMGEDLFTETAEQAERLTNTAVRTAGEQGVSAVGVVVEAPRSFIASSVLNTASRWRADLIVVARRDRRRISRLLFGSISDQIVREASCPVLLIRSVPR